jgi:hypothetical protein
MAKEDLYRKKAYYSRQQSKPSALETKWDLLAMLAFLLIFIFILEVGVYLISIIA